MPVMLTILCYYAFTVGQAGKKSFKANNNKKAGLFPLRQHQPITPFYITQRTNCLVWLCLAVSITCFYCSKLRKSRQQGPFFHSFCQRAKEELARHINQSQWLLLSAAKRSTTFGLIRSTSGLLFSADDFEERKACKQQSLLTLKNFWVILFFWVGFRKSSNK